jgi:hypothetical protein
MYLRQSVGLGSVWRRKYTLSPNVKLIVLGICVLYERFVIVLLFAQFLWLFFVKPMFSIYFRKLSVVKLLRYKSEGRWFDPRWCHGIFYWYKSFWSHYGPGVDTVSNRNEYRELFLEVNAAGAYGWHLLNASEAFPTEWFLQFWEKSKSGGLSPTDFDVSN